MSGVLQHRRMGTATRVAFTPANGELIWDIDLFALYMGDGVTAGGLFVGGIAGQKYIVASFVPGLFTASQLILYHRFAKAVTFPANFGPYLSHNSEAGGTNAATASTVINVDKAVSATPNTFSNVGTITIGAGTVTPTFATSGGTEKNFAQGDVLRLIGPASPDATFAGFYATLVAFET